MVKVGRRSLWVTVWPRKVSNFLRYSPKRTGRTPRRQRGDSHSFSAITRKQGGGRTKGPLFLTDRKARVHLAAADLDPESGRARLSYRRAAELFTAATATCPGGPWTLHQLRHSALTHAAEDGANTSTLLAFSGHTNVASLARYSRVSAEALARWQHQRDPHRRR